MTVSIIIAVRTWQKNLEECIAKCRELDYPDFEVLVFPDNPIDKDLRDPLVKVIATGPAVPAYKRDVAVGYASGEILAFIDDDAYPRRDWLKNAVSNFNSPEVAAVGGPGITPQEDNLRQKASGLVYSSLLVSGKYVYRYVPKTRMEVDDLPSCNFVIRKSIMQELGGFKTNFWPGEDTKLCLGITKGLGKKIIYDPEVIVYHHRRNLFLPHLKQIADYALHRGYFVKKYPETSLRMAYFVPSIFLLFLLAGGALTLRFSFLKSAYIFILYFYLLSVIIFSIHKDLRLFPLILPGIITSHFTYGIYFIKGLVSKRLKEENS